MSNEAEYTLKCVKYIGNVTACIVDLINNNQKIKRYCRYKTKTPLLPFGIISGKRIEQPDIYTNLDEPILNDEKNEVESAVLFDAMFDPDMQTKLEMGIFVYDYNSNFDKTFGDCAISIDIIVPYNYEKLQSKGDKRTIMLADEIVNTICSNSITEENNKYWFDLLGNIEFSLKKITNGRLSQKNNSIRRTIIINTSIHKHPVLK